MVQKNAPTKLATQAKQEDTSFSSHPKGKNRGGTGAELKKTMKKSSSKSAKRSDIEALRSSPVHGMSPPTGLLAFQQRQGVTEIAPTTPPKQSPTQLSNGSSPNYMKPTSSSISRKERARASASIVEFPKLGSESDSGRERPRALSRTCGLKRAVSTLTKAPSFKHPGKKSSATKCSRATCSSTMKDSRFPSCLVLDPDCEAMSALKVCPYTYCSLCGHHSPPSPSLRRLMPAKKKLLKAQKSEKSGEEKPAFQEEGFFVEVYVGKKQGGSANNIEHDGVETSEQEGQTPPHSGFTVTNVDIEKGSGNEDEYEDDDSVHCHDVTDMESGCPSDSCDELIPKPDEDTREVDLKGDFNTNSNEEASDTCNVSMLPKGCKRPNPEGEEEIRKFNPRGPNFLPLEADPEVEKVDLRHQMIGERRNAEEWMLDYALRQAVTSLAAAHKRRVAFLVEAFETVLPIPDSETDTMNASSPPFAHTRPIEACS